MVLQITLRIRFADVANIRVQLSEQVLDDQRVRLVGSLDQELNYKSTLMRSPNQCHGKPLIPTGVLGGAIPKLKVVVDAVNHALLPGPAGTAHV